MVYWTLKKSRYEQQLLSLGCLFTLFLIIIYGLQGYVIFAGFAVIFLIFFYTYVFFSPSTIYIAYFAGHWIFMDSRQRRFTGNQLQALWYTRFGMTLKLFDEQGKTKYWIIFSDQFQSHTEHHFRWHLKMSSIMLKGMSRKSS